jgi:hypothetical protein
MAATPMQTTGTTSEFTPLRLSGADFFRKKKKSRGGRHFPGLQQPAQQGVKRDVSRKRCLQQGVERDVSPKQCLQQGVERDVSGKQCLQQGVERGVSGKQCLQQGVERGVLQKRPTKHPVERSVLQKRLTKHPVERSVLQITCVCERCKAACRPPGSRRYHFEGCSPGSARDCGRKIWAEIPPYSLVFIGGALAFCGHFAGLGAVPFCRL